MKIGIFGGSFNPVHNMHKNIALELIEKEYLDMVIYVPTGDKYEKRDLINFNDRLEMVKLMIADNDRLGVSDIGNSNNHQYTYQVLDYFKNIYGDDDIYFICGSDNLEYFDTWIEYEYILKYYKLLVIKRNGDNVYEILTKYDKYKDKIIITDVESRVLSSTSIRENLKKNIMDGNIEKEVYVYIKEKKLYR